EVRDAIDAVLGVEAELRRHHAFGKRRRQSLWVEQGCLHAIIEARDGAQETIDRASVGDDVTAGQQGQRAKAQAGAQEQPPLDIAHLALAETGIAHPALDAIAFEFSAHYPSPDEVGAGTVGGARPVIMGSNTLGTSRVSATCTITNPTMPTMPRK